MPLSPKNSCLLSLAIPFAAAAASAETPEKIQFNRDIRPILSDNCYYCHGPDKDQREGDLRLDIRQEAIDAYAIIPGDSSDSELVLRIFNDDPEELMPRPSSHKILSPEEKNLLVRWIDEGANYQEHWSYTLINKPPFARMDDLVSNELAKRSLAFSPQAEKRTLIRRVSLDLIGLPPTPAEVKAFLADDSPDAYAQLVDRLLASPRYGEKMAIPWLDAVRYADTVGYHGDQERDATPFRDYVIEAFNTNKPFDQFTIEQIAGDLLPNPTLKQKIAASYNRLNQISREGGIQDKEYVKKYQAERVRTTATTWLGSTMACAECHDHKFDPFTAKDFYSMAAFFADILEKGAYTNDGSYQEDIDSYLATDLKNEGWFGPELTVPNDTFHPNLQSAQSLIAQKESALATGSPEAEAEFKIWLQQQKKLAARHLPGTLPLVFDPKIDDGKIALSSPHASLESLAAIQFDAKSQANNGALELQIDYQIDEEQKSQIFTWGSPRSSKDIPRKQIAPKLYRSQWHSLQLLADDLQLPANATLSAIKPLHPDQADVKNIALRFRYKSSKYAALSSQAAAALETCIENPNADTTALKREFFIHHAETFAPQRIEIDNLKHRIEGHRYTPLTISAKPREVKVLPRGNWMDESGETVLPASPGFLPNPVQSSNEKRLSRLDLAKWIVHPDNPLTSRAFANRLWALFFESPLSSAPEDLGLQGEYPPYPDLLDWLAAEFVESGWDVKHLVRSIVLSQTYRQTSKASPEAFEADPKNRFLARQSPVRLSAEIIRDNALQISGLLSDEMGGPSVRPYQPEGYYSNLNFPKRVYEADTNESQYRRGVYVHWQRTFLHPMMAAFDAGGRDECSVKRDLSNTPLQALNLLNDPTHVEAAHAFAKKLLAAENTDKARIKAAFLHALAREPSPSESRALQSFLKRERKRFRAEQNDATPYLDIGLLSPESDDPPAQLAALTSLCRAILNLHETITRY